MSPFQKGVFWDDRRYVAAASGRGCGKTTSVTCAWIGKLNRGEIPPGSRLLVFGPSYPQLRMGTIKTFDKFFDQTGYVLKKIDGNEPERRLTNDIVVYFRNASDPEQTRSHETTLVWLDEFGQMREDVLTLCNASQRQWGSDFNYQTYITSTPRGKNHFYRRFQKIIDKHRSFVADGVSRTQRRKWNECQDELNNDERSGFYQTTTRDAKSEGIDLPEGYIEGIIENRGADWEMQEVEGEFVSWAGLVFAEFDPRKHISPAVPVFTRVYGGIDVGYGGVTAMLLTGLTAAGSMYTFKEYYQKQAQTQDWMKLAAEWGRQYNVRRWAIDSSADIEFRAMKSAGMPVVQSMKARDAAGGAVGFINSKLARNELFIGECPNLISEIETYQYKEILSGDEVTFLDKTKPNQPDHAIDAWRYHILPLSSAMVQYGQSLEFSVG